MKMFIFFNRRVLLKQHDKLFQFKILVTIFRNGWHLCLSKQPVFLLHNTVEHSNHEIEGNATFFSPHHGILIKTKFKTFL